VEVVGFVPDLIAELATADVSVVPLWAGGGTRLKVLEAMAAKVPIVGTPLAVEGIGFDDGIHGLVREAPAEIAAGAVELITDRARAGRLAAAAQELAEHFRWSRVLRPVEALYEELGQETGAGSRR
jgi:glycosyltransferase involved in cell wall biosynthesis